MAGKCKLCACDESTRAMVERRLRMGESVKDIATDLGTQGIIISGMSVLRHKKNHMEEFQQESEEKKYSLDDMKGHGLTIDVESVLEEIETELLDRDYQEAAILERLKTQVLLERICQKQLVIVDQLQDRYMLGEGGYPNDQIRGLKTILEMFSGLPAYKDSDLKTGYEKVNKDVKLRREKKGGYEATAAFADTYQQGDIFSGKGLPANPHHPTIGAYQEVNPLYAKWQEGLRQWLEENPSHKYTTDVQTWEYISACCKGDVDKFGIYMEMARKQKRPTLEWIKSQGLEQ